ncbi:MAG TPA: tetratricopeptide repeat protein, partial [Thermoanaerobaculia bacterium]
SVIAEFPGNVVARSGRAEVLKSQDRLDEALSAYESVIAEFPADVVARSGRAEVLKSQSRLDEALSAYESVIAEFPGGRAAKNGYASLLALMQRWKEALAVLPEQSPTTKDDWIGYHIRGMVLLRMGKFDEAVAIFERGVAECPRPAQRAYFATALTIALLKRKSYPEAKDTLEKVRSSELEAQLNVLRFHAYGALGNTVRAVEASESLRPSESHSPRIREIGAELRRRYIEKRPPLQSDDWLVEREIDLLLAA